MKLTIVADDKRVGVNNEFIDPIELTQLDQTIHAVQWYGEYGEVEYKTRIENGKLVKPENLLITDMSPFQFAVDAWTNAKTQMEADRLAAEEAARLAQQSE